MDPSCIESIITVRNKLNEYTSASEVDSIDLTAVFEYNK